MELRINTTANPTKCLILADNFLPLQISLQFHLRGVHVHVPSFAAVALCVIRQSLCSLSEIPALQLWMKNSASRGSGMLRDLSTKDIIEIIGVV